MPATMRLRPALLPALLQAPPQCLLLAHRQRRPATTFHVRPVRSSDQRLKLRSQVFIGGDAPELLLAAEVHDAQRRIHWSS